jgi:hypothetical protein
MKAKINCQQLNTSQKQLLVAYREKWSNLTLYVDTDTKKTEQAVKTAYIRANLPEPQQFIWVRDPLEVAIASQIIQHGNAENTN